MRLRDLPGFPSLYLDFIEGAAPARGAFACGPGRDSLLQRAAHLAQRAPGPGIRPLPAGKAAGLNGSSAAQDNLRRLALPGTLAVVARVAPRLLGGSLSRLFQCLTAIKLAGALESEGHAAVPLAWVSGPASTEQDVCLLDGESRIVHLAAGGHKTYEVLLNELLGIYRSDIQNTSSYKVVRDTLGAGATPGRGTGLLFSALLAEHGLVVVDGGDADLRASAPAPLGALGNGEIRTHVLSARRRLSDLGYGACAAEARANDPVEAVEDLLLMNSLLPVAAQVVAPAEICGTAALHALFEAARIEEPLTWPVLSATLVDARSRKTLDRYGLELPELFAGRDRLLAKVDEDLGGAPALATFDRLLGEIDSHMHDAGLLVPAGDALREAVSDSQSRMRYQLTKLKERFASSLTVRRDAAGRQLARLCDSLAPEGRRQESRLSAIHFVLRYSRALFDEILRKSDVWDFQHQLISLD